MKKKKEKERNLTNLISAMNRIVIRQKLPIEDFDCLSNNEQGNVQSYRNYILYEKKETEFSIVHENSTNFNNVLLPDLYIVCNENGEPNTQFSSKSINNSIIEESQAKKSKFEPKRYIDSFTDTMHLPIDITPESWYRPIESFIEREVYKELSKYYGGESLEYYKKRCRKHFINRKYDENDNNYESKFTYSKVEHIYETNYDLKVINYKENPKTEEDIAQELHKLKQDYLNKESKDKVNRKKSVLSTAESPNRKKKEEEILIDTNLENMLKEQIYPFKVEYEPSDVVFTGVDNLTYKWIGSAIQGIKDSSLCDVNSRKSIYNCIFPQKNSIPIYNDFGKYAIKLYLNGNLICIEIDDLIPCNDIGVPLFPYVEDSKEIFSLLLTKALVKLYNIQFSDHYNYNTLSIYQIYHSLTGYLMEEYIIKDHLLIKPDPAFLLNSIEKIGKLISNENQKLKKYFLFTFKEQATKPKVKKQTMYDFSNLSSFEPLVFEDKSDLQKPKIRASDFNKSYNTKDSSKMLFTYLKRKSDGGMKDSKMSSERTLQSKFKIGGTSVEKSRKKLFDKIPIKNKLKKEEEKERERKPSSPKSRKKSKAKNEERVRTVNLSPESFNVTPSGINRANSNATISCYYNSNNQAALQKIQLVSLPKKHILSVVEIFHNYKFNMLKLKPMDFSDLKAKYKLSFENSNYKLMNNKEKKEFIIKLQENKKIFKEKRKERLECLNNQGDDIFLIRLVSNMAQFDLSKCRFYPIGFNKAEIKLGNYCIVYGLSDVPANINKTSISVYTQKNMKISTAGINEIRKRSDYHNEIADDLQLMNGDISHLIDLNKKLRKFVNNNKLKIEQPLYYYDNAREDGNWIFLQDLFTIFNRIINLINPNTYQYEIKYSNQKQAKEFIIGIGLKNNMKEKETISITSRSKKDNVVFKYNVNNSKNTKQSVFKDLKEGDDLLNLNSSDYHNCLSPINQDKNEYKLLLNIRNSKNDSLKKGNYLTFNLFEHKDDKLEPVANEYNNTIFTSLSYSNNKNIKLSEANSTTEITINPNSEYILMCNSGFFNHSIDILIKSNIQLSELSTSDYLLNYKNYQSYKITLDKINIPNAKEFFVLAKYQILYDGQSDSTTFSLYYKLPSNFKSELLNVILLETYNGSFIRKQEVQSNLEFTLKTKYNYYIVFETYHIDKITSSIDIDFLSSISIFLDKIELNHCFTIKDTIRLYPKKAKVVINDLIHYFKNTHVSFLLDIECCLIKNRIDSESPNKLNTTRSKRSSIHKITLNRKELNSVQSRHKVDNGSNSKKSLHNLNLNVDYPGFQLDFNEYNKLFFENRVIVHTILDYMTNTEDLINEAFNIPFIVNFEGSDGKQMTTGEYELKWRLKIFSSNEILLTPNILQKEKEQNEIDLWDRKQPGRKENAKSLRKNNLAVSAYINGESIDIIMEKETNDYLITKAIKASQVIKNIKSNSLNLNNFKEKVNSSKMYNSIINLETELKAAKAYDSSSIYKTITETNNKLHLNYNSRKISVKPFILEQESTSKEKLKTENKQQSKSTIFSDFFKLSQCNNKIKQSNKNQVINVSICDFKASNSKKTSQAKINKDAIQVLDTIKYNNSVNFNSFNTLTNHSEELNKTYYNLRVVANRKLEPLVKNRQSIKEEVNYRINK